MTDGTWKTNDLAGFFERMSITRVDGMVEGSKKVTIWMGSGWRFDICVQDLDERRNLPLAEIAGDPERLRGGRIVRAEETTRKEDDAELPQSTWTFFRIGTDNGGHVVLRWMDTYREAVRLRISAWRT